MSSTTISPSFRSILDAALAGYSKQTGIDLTRHPSACKLQSCHTSREILQVFRDKEMAFRDYRDENRKLINHLFPVGEVVHGFSGTFASFKDRPHLMWPLTVLCIVFSFLLVMFGCARSLLASVQAMTPWHLSTYHDLTVWGTS
jgi:hypothetical protein